jgi:hypothetical protein
MEFLQENFLWIMIAIIVILMAIVGYIADKTGFISKSDKVSKETKQKKEEKKDVPIVIEDKGINELTKKTMDPIYNKEEKVDNEKIDPALFAPLPGNENINSLDSNDSVEELKNIDVTPLEVNQNEEVNDKLLDNVVNPDEDIWKF